MSTPSIKGSAISLLFEDLREFVSQGVISEEDLARYLQPDDRKLLEQPPSRSGWYCVETHRRALELIRDTVGHGSNAYVVDRGRRQGEQLMESGFYQQLEYAGRAGVMSAKSPEERVAAFGRDLKLIVTLSRSIFNFTKWRVLPDPEHADRLLIEVSEAEPLPDIVIHTIVGFMESLVTAMGMTRLWAWERPTPDRILFRMIHTL